ncbi:MAG TPA: PAS domain S-box protein, partial [Polyangiaceae bacterium]|nr:PAS domain S-box protein [Polyangiaceae bacterium]
MLPDLSDNDAQEPGSEMRAANHSDQLTDHFSEGQRWVLDALPVAIAIIENHGVFWANSMFLEMFGYRREEVLGLSTSAYFANRAEYERAINDAAAVIAEGRVFSVEVLMRRKNGEAFWGNATARAVQLGQPNAGVLWTAIDVTQRRQTEEELRWSEARLDAAQRDARVGSWGLGSDFEPVYWSKQMFAMFGFDPRSGIPPHDVFLELMHPEDRELVLKTHREALESRSPRRVTYRIGSEQDSIRYYETTIVPELDDQGNLLRTTGTTQDITELKRSELALLDSERRLQSLIQNSNDIFVVIGADGSYKSLRGPVRAMLGYDPDELAGEAFRERIHPDDAEITLNALSEAMAHPGLTYRAEYRCRHKQGHWLPMEAVGTSWLHDPSLAGIVLNLRDISERKAAEEERGRLQEQLQQAIKMEAIGRLAGGVAHDFNNLLTVIGGNVELALSELNPADPLARHLADVRDATNSAASLTRQLLAFSRRQLFETKVVNLNDLVTDLHKMLGRLIGEDIALEIRLATGLGAVRIDPGQFDQVLVNLAVNARDAMPKGGRLVVETANVVLDAAYCRGRELRPGQFVQLSVSDNGIGMTPEVKSRIFEPFFTTKPLGAGTGLGLSVIFGVVKQAGGAIETYSEPGHGTTFKIYLPRVDEPAQRLEKARLRTESMRGTETILLVEDNESVRELTTKILKRLGYNLIVTDNGRNALGVVCSSHPKLDLLFTDLVLNQAHSFVPAG